MPSVTLCGGPHDGATIEMDYFGLLDAPTYIDGIYGPETVHNLYTWDDPEIGIAIYQQPVGRGYG